MMRHSEKRLIYLDHALQAVSENYQIDMPKHDLDMLVATRQRLKSMPTVDAVEVVHGRWIEHAEIGAMNNHYECTVCHWKTPFFTVARDSNYCPNCGAKMDGDGNA